MKNTVQIAHVIFQNAVAMEYYDPIKAASYDGMAIEPHDRAVVRALRCNYNPFKDSKINGDPLKTLFVGRLNPRTTQRTLRQFFSKYQISSVRLVRDATTGENRRYAFVTFLTIKDTELAWRENGKLIDNFPILIEYEKERLVKGWVPRRYGGGLGGRKESGQIRFGGRDKPFKKFANFKSFKTHQASNIKTRKKKKSTESKPTEPSFGTVVNLDDLETGELRTVHLWNRLADNTTRIADIT